MIKPNILFPNFEKIVGFVSLTSSKSIKPFFPKSTCFSIIPNGFIIAAVPLLAARTKYF